MCKKWSSLSVCIALALACHGQTLVRSQTLLAGARQDPAVTLQGEHLDLVQQANLRLPLIEQVSLRTETDRFQLQRQEYLSRLSINGLREIKQQNLLNAAERLEIKSRQRLLPTKPWPTATQPWWNTGSRNSKQSSSSGSQPYTKTNSGCSTKWPNST